MRFGLKQLLITVLAISAFLGYAISNGLGVAIVFAIVASLAAFCVMRLLSGWANFNVFQRIYASVSALGAAGLLAIFVFSVATSPSLANDRATRNLRFSLLGDERFSSTTIEYHETKINYVTVSGSVATESDLNALRSTINQRRFLDLDALIWDVTIRESGRHLDGWDSELFDESQL